MDYIPITKPYIGECEKEAVVKVLESGWLVQGRYVAEFEKLFAEYTGGRFAKALSNCTTALHISLEAMGIGRRDKVIVPSFTYVASANAVEYTGAEVVFCDINLRTFNIDENKIEDLIKEDSSIKAVMPVNLFGLCANLPQIVDISNKYGLRIIEDSACGFDSWINGKHSGTFGDCGCFSFHPRKAVTTGEGGMIITGDAALNKKVSILRDHGAEKSDSERDRTGGGSLLPDFNVRGYNYRMTDIQGAIGVCQMKKAKDIISGRRKIVNLYDENLKNVNEVITPCVPGGYVHGYQSYVIIFRGQEDLSDLTKKKIDGLNVKRNILMKKLESRGIATRQGTHAVHTLGYYKNKYNLKDEDFLASYAADRLSIALPLYAGMTGSEFNYAIETIKSCLNTL